MPSIDHSANYKMINRNCELLASLIYRRRFQIERTSATDVSRKMRDETLMETND